MRNTDKRPPASERALRARIAGSAFPCLGAKAAMNQQGLVIVQAPSMKSDAADARLHRRIARFLRSAAENADRLHSLCIIFAGPFTFSEKDFESALWARLQAWTDIDVALGFGVDPAISADPGHPRFGLSFGGHGCFAVGLHPRASRRARRFAWPAVVLNPHGQFQRLREQGKYETMRRAILARDKALQGNVNPMLARHGESSEARQYSGRRVDASWQCPFSRSDREDMVA